MERKKLIRIAIFVLIIIAGLIIAENSIRGVGYLVENKKEKDKLKEQENIYINSEEYKKKEMLEGIVSDFVKLLNSNSIDALYDLIDLDYRDYKFQNKKELFEDYIKSYINNNSKITLQTHQKINGKYLCRLLSESNEELKSFVALIEPEEDNSYNVIFDNITSIEKMSEVYKGKTNIEYQLLYKVMAENVCSYTIEFSNPTKNSINYNYDTIKLRDTYGNSFFVDTNNLKISIEPGEKIRENIVFYDNRIHDFPKTYFDIALKDVNENINYISIYLGTSI